MEFTTYYRSNSILILDGEQFGFFAFKWTEKRCFVLKMNGDREGFNPDLTTAKVVFAWETTSYNVEEVARAIFRLTGVPCEVRFDEDYDPVFRAWHLKGEESPTTEWRYNAMVKELNEKEV